MRETTVQGKVRLGRRGDPIPKHGVNVTFWSVVYRNEQAPSAETLIYPKGKRLGVSGMKFSVTEKKSAVTGKRLSVSPICPLQCMPLPLTESLRNVSRFSLTYGPHEPVA